MDTEHESAGEYDRGLTLESAPSTGAQVGWPVLVVLVAAAFVVGTGAGYGLGIGAEASPAATPATISPETSTAAEAPDVTADPDAWPWLEGKLPDRVAGATTTKTSVRDYREDPARSAAERLAAACSVEMDVIASAEAAWASDESVELFYVPGCPAHVLLDAYLVSESEPTHWVEITVSGKQVRFLGVGFFGGTWLYARTQLLYVISGPVPEFPWPPLEPPLDDPLVGQHPIVTEILSAVP